MRKQDHRVFATSAAALVLVATAWIALRRQAPVRHEPAPAVAVTPTEPRPNPRTRGKSSRAATGAHDLADEGPAPMVILEEIVINQEHRKLGSSPDIDAALARLPVLEKCVQSPLEIVRLPSLDSHIRMHVGILRRFKKPKEARQWLTQVRGCSPHARMEIIKAYFID